MTRGPYDGLKVFDLSHVIAGPFCTHLLADMGADVVRIEPRRGDLMRQLPAVYDDDLSSAFAQYNCGKRSACVDLKTEAGREIALRLVEWADVVVENFSPGVLDRLGLSYEVMAARNDKVILCSLSTFGAVGPYSSMSGFGATAEAYSGLMSLTGEEGGPPMHFGTPLADMTSGVHALAAIGAALHMRTQTGKGTQVDISSFDSLFAMIDQAVALGEFTGGKRTFGRYGTTHSITVPSGIVSTADGGYVTYGCPGDALFRSLAEAMGEPALADDPRYATIEARVEHRDDVYARIASWADPFESADALVAHLAQFGVPAARVRAVEENLQDPHLIERGTLSPVEFEGVGEVLVQTAPYRFSDAVVRPQGPAPHIGEHTVEVLRDLVGLDAATICSYQEEGIVYTYREEGK